MSDYSITQDQIDALLNEVSVEERIQNQLALIKTKIGRMLHKSASRELLRIKKDLLGQMKLLESGKPYSPDFVDSFKTDFQNLSKEILEITQDYTLFEHIVKMENYINAMFYSIEQDRRRYPRFPLTIDLFLTLDGETHTLFGIDISSVGLAFYAPLALAVGRRHTIFTRATEGESLVVDILRATRVEPERMGVWQTICTFPNLMKWEQIRDVIIGTVRNGL